MNQAQKQQFPPAIEKMRQDSDVWKIDQIGESQTYLVRYHDASGALYDAEGKRVKSYLDKFEFITGYSYLGKLGGKEHFGFIGVRDYESRYSPERYMMNENGHIEYFRDPRLNGCDTLTEMKEEFDKLVEQENDPCNSRRNDPQIISDREQQSLQCTL